MISYDRIQIDSPQNSLLSMPTLHINKHINNIKVELLEAVGKKRINFIYSRNKLTIRLLSDKYAS
jgi:hypothetical protein